MIPKLHRSHLLSYAKSRSVSSMNASTTSGAINSADPTFKWKKTLVNHPSLIPKKLHFFIFRFLNRAYKNFYEYYGYRSTESWCWYRRSKLWIELDSWPKIKIAQFHRTQLVFKDAKYIFWFQIPVRNTYQNNSDVDSIVKKISSNDLSLKSHQNHNIYLSYVETAERKQGP